MTLHPPIDLTAVIDRLTQHGLTGNVVPADVDYIEADLVGGVLQITPTAEQDGWIALHTDTNSYETDTVYRSHPGGPDQANGLHLPPLLAAIDAVLTAA